MKIMMIVNTDGALYVFRKPIIQKLIDLGHAVVSISSKSHYFQKIKDLGVEPISLDFARHSISVTQNFGILVRLYYLIKLQKPDIVHCFTHKPAIYGTIAARIVGVKGIFITITGLGTLFVRNDTKAKFLRWILLIQYKFALQFASVVFFQNPDDMDYFVSHKIIDSNKVTLTNGSGIDLLEYAFPSIHDVNQAKLKLAEEIGIDLSCRKIVLFTARGVKEKGFYEFYEAAKIVNNLEPDKYLFIHLGLVDSESSSQISKNRIDIFASNCGVQYLGFKDNIKFYMKASDIVVLPSYGEGTPRSLIEALAFGKVILTTDAPGCRETVVDGWNGFLCKIGDVNSLVAKMLAINNSFIEIARSRSRKYCEKKYDVSMLVDKTIESYLDFL